jgi:Tfp pilus assembly protein, pilus retraction ATPase PilT
MSLTELILQAKAKKAQQLLFVVGSEPRAKINSQWVSLRKSPGLPTEWGLLQQSLLSSAQKGMLESRGRVIGETALETTRIGYSFFQDESTMKAVLQLDLDNSKQELALPGGLLETCLQMKGMVVLASPQRGGQSLLLHRLLQKMNEEKPFLAVIYSQRPFSQIKEEKATFIYQTGHPTKESEESLLEGADVVVFEGLQESEDFVKAMELAERGYFVIYSMNAPSMGNVLSRGLSVLNREFAAHGPARWAEVLKLVFCQYSMPGLGGESVFAHEMMLMKSGLQHLLAKGDVVELTRQLVHAPEQSGQISLNQSLLQHLIRRRIDLKTAFETSFDPEALDQHLKKVGI